MTRFCPPCGNISTPHQHLIPLTPTHPSCRAAAARRRGGKLTVGIPPFPARRLSSKLGIWSSRSTPNGARLFKSFGGMSKEPASSHLSASDRELPQSRGITPSWLELSNSGSIPLSDCSPAAALVCRALQSLTSGCAESRASTELMCVMSCTSKYSCRVS